MRATRKPHNTSVSRKKEKNSVLLGIYKSASKYLVATKTKREKFVFEVDLSGWCARQ